MSKLPRPTGAEMVRFLESPGFTVVRIRGSHHVMAKGALRTVVPIHAGQALRIGTLRGVLRDIDMSPAQFADRAEGGALLRALLHPKHPNGPALRHLRVLAGDQAV